MDNQKVTVRGSEVLNLKWKPYKNGIWQAKITQNLIFDQLFVNGQLQLMARYPNFDPSAQYYNGFAADAVSKERASLWKSPSGGYVHALHSSKWGDYHYLLKGKDKQGELVLEGGWQNNRQMGMHNEYRFVENIFEELDTVNEWFYDKETIPAVIVHNSEETNEIINFMGAKVKNLTTLGEQSATGMDAIRGVLVLEVPLNSPASSFLQSNDLILSFNNEKINNVLDLLVAFKSMIGTNTEVVVFRNQKEVKKWIEFKSEK